MDLYAAVEAILFAAGEPVPVNRLSLVLETEERDIELCINSLEEFYTGNSRGIRLLRFDNKVQLCSAPEYAPIINKALEKRKPAALSQSALEVLAVVAYFQPVTRAYIEKIRGVDSAYTISVLSERGLIEVCGRLDAPGRPTLFRTTDVFLRTMSIQSVEELPPLPDLTNSEGIERLKASIEELKAREDNPNQMTLFEMN